MTAPCCGRNWRTTGKPQEIGNRRIDIAAMRSRENQPPKSGKSLNGEPTNPGRLPNKPRAASNDPEAHRCALRRCFDASLSSSSRKLLHEDHAKQS